MALAFFNILIFPGLAFLALFALLGQFLDRKLYARLQNRIGPPWYQPFADFLKLAGKEEIIPEEANPRIFRMTPIFAVAAAASAYFYIPTWRQSSLFSFHGDLIVVIYLLTIPTLTYFLGGWYSTSLYSKIGAVRSLTQLFAYEVPLLICLLSPSLLANSWSITGIASYYESHPWLWSANILGFAISIVTMLGKLEKVPFDIPEAETEIVAGTFTEYSGLLFAFFRLALDIETVVGASLLAAVFLPFGLRLPLVPAVMLYFVKVIGIICILAVARTIFARLRIDQMLSFCWKFLAPLAFLQFLFCLVLKGLLHQ